MRLLRTAALGLTLSVLAAGAAAAADAASCCCCKDKAPQASCCDKMKDHTPAAKPGDAKPPAPSEHQEHKH